MISWDESKRRENIRRHRIDLAELEPVFDGPMVTVEDSRESYGELLSGHRAMKTPRT